MSRIIDAETFIRRRQEHELRNSGDSRVVETTPRARYARSGTGYRFIPAGSSIFDMPREQGPRVA